MDTGHYTIQLLNQYQRFGALNTFCKEIYIFAARYSASYVSLLLKRNPFESNNLHWNQQLLAISAHLLLTQICGLRCSGFVNV